MNRKLRFLPVCTGRREEKEMDSFQSISLEQKLLWHTRAKKNGRQTFSLCEKNKPNVAVRSEEGR
jgi:hypothetical protein